MHSCQGGGAAQLLHTCRPRPSIAFSWRALTWCPAPLAHPCAGKLVELELAAVAGKLRSQLRNPGQLEVTVTALQIAALKRLGKGSSIYLLDRSGGTAKQVAKELASRGFGRVFVVAGGFQGWQNSKLRTRPSSTVSRVEVLQPGSRASARIIPAVARTVQVLPPVGRSAQRALPSGRS